MKGWCALAVCALLIPQGYEAARQAALGQQPAQDGRESVAADQYVISKQSIGAGSLLSALSETVSDGSASLLQAQSTGTAVVAGTAPGTEISPDGSSTSTQTTSSGVRVIHSSGSNGSDTQVGPGAEYTPVSSVTTPITGYLGGSKINLLANQTASQMMSVLVETNQGNLIMIDGGLEGDAEHLIETLSARGGVVDAWLITHPHSDHIGALNYILSNPDCGITVNNIYYSFADISWYQEYESYRADTVQTLMDTLATVPSENLHGDIYKGQEIQVDNVTITVMNLPYLFSSNSINNSSVAYMLDINGKKALFLGDMGEEAGNQLLADNSAEALKCDIVQMSHHGQYGVSKTFYQTVEPEICLWTCPQWLWDNDNGGGVDSGSWYTVETRRWMAELGVPYHVCIKDGDQVIQ